MAEQAPIYDLLLLLDADAPEEQRQKVLSGVQSAIASAGGAAERNDDWGRRPMAYEIRHRPEAEYHLLQFRAPGAAIEELSHTLRITDGVLRFRIIKVRRGTPAVKSTPPPVVAAVATASGGYSAPSESSSASEEAAPSSAGGPPSEGDAPPAAEESSPAEEAPPAETANGDEAAGAAAAGEDSADE